MAIRNWFGVWNEAFRSWSVVLQPVVDDQLGVRVVVIDAKGVLHLCIIAVNALEAPSDCVPIAVRGHGYCDSKADLGHSEDL
jgi:hypothetical protein